MFMLGWPGTLRGANMPEQVLENPFSKPLNIGYMLRNSPPALDHVLPGLLAATVGLLVGPGAVSKTMLALQVGIAMATGTPMLGGLVGETGAGPLQPQRVVLVLAEESANIVWHRLHAIASVQLATTGIDLETAAELLQHNLVIHALAGGDQVNLLGDCWERTSFGELLRRACEGARLVILDPVRDFHNADENDSTAMKALARHITSYATSTGAAWLLVHHASRAAGLNGYGGSADAGRGSTALTNAVRWQMNLSRPTRETAKQHGIPADLINLSVLVDIPKANYIEATGTLVARRGPHGVLMQAEDLA
jgi:RecA-family ATPase